MDVKGVSNANLQINNNSIVTERRSQSAAPAKSEPSPSSDSAERTESPSRELPEGVGKTLNAEA